MTKKHFIALADELRLAHKAGKIDPLVMEAILRFCRRMNPAFDEVRWLDYLDGKAGPNGGKFKKEKA